MEPIIDAASESLRREAMTDGLIDPGKFPKWQGRYRDAIRALPPEVQTKFSSAAAASQAYEDAAAVRKAALEDHQSDLTRRLIGLSTGQDVTRTVGAIFGSRNAVEQMRDLARRVAGNREAEEGLRKAIADHISTLATGTTEAGASGVNKVNASTFQRFLTRNEAVLKEAGFTEAQLSNMRALANDLQRAQRTMQATALPASPNSAADLIAAGKIAAKESRGPSLLSKLLAGSWAGLHVGGVYGAATGAVGAIGEHLARSLRGAGLAKAKDILQAGLLDPEIGRQLLRRASELPDPATEAALARAIAKRSIFSVPGMNAALYGSQGEKK
jgi:hypothetical protein